MHCQPVSIKIPVEQSMLGTADRKNGTVGCTGCAAAKKLLYSRTFQSNTSRKLDSSSHLKMKCLPADSLVASADKDTTSSF